MPSIIVYRYNPFKHENNWIFAVSGHTGALCFTFQPIETYQSADSKGHFLLREYSLIKL